MCCSNVKAVAVGVLVGAAAGVMIGLLCAPQPGTDTREMLKRKSASVMARAKGQA
jgi:gas vesicle protein